MANSFHSVAAELDCSIPEQMELVYQKLRAPCLSKVSYMIDNIELARDIVQDGFLKIWNEKRTFASLDDAYRWLYRCCHNAAIDYIRHHQMRDRNHSQIRVTQEFRQIASPEDRVHNRLVLTSMLNQISDRTATVLAYRVIDDLTLKEISDLMGISAKTVQRELMNLSDQFGEMDGGGQNASNG